MDELACKTFYGKQLREDSKATENTKSQYTNACVFKIKNLHINPKFTLQSHLLHYFLSNTKAQTIFSNQQALLLSPWSSPFRSIIHLKKKTNQNSRKTKSLDSPTFCLPAASLSSYETCSNTLGHLLSAPSTEVLPPKAQLHKVGQAQMGLLEVPLSLSASPPVYSSTCSCT